MNEEFNCKGCERDLAKCSFGLFEGEFYCFKCLDKKRRDSE